MQETMSKNYALLGVAVIAQAARDYLAYKKRLSLIDHNTSEGKHLTYEIESLKRFFKSDWFKVLSNADGEWLMRELDKEYIEWKIEYNRKHGKRLEL